MKKITKPGIYKFVNINNTSDKYLVLIGGALPFLTIEVIWDMLKNRTSGVGLRGKSFEIFEYDFTLNCDQLKML